MLVNHMVDMALVSPLGYGSGVGKVDLRLIPGPCMVLKDYTNIAGIRFRDNLEEINTVGSHQPATFLPVIGSLLMREKFEAPPSPVQKITKGAPADCMIDLNTPEDGPAAMDVSEEWFDLAEMPLPIAVWACRVEAELDKVEDAVKTHGGEPPAGRSGDRTDHLGRRGAVPARRHDLVGVESGRRGSVRRSAEPAVFPSGVTGDPGDQGAWSRGVVVLWL